MHGLGSLTGKPRWASADESKKNQCKSQPKIEIDIKHEKNVFIWNVPAKRNLTSQGTINFKMPHLTALSSLFKIIFRSTMSFAHHFSKCLTGYGRFKPKYLSFGEGPFLRLTSQFEAYALVLLYTKNLKNRTTGIWDFLAWKL